MMMKAFLVVFAVLAATLGLVSGLIALGVGENSVPAVAIAVASGIFAAIPASWYVVCSRQYG